MFTKNRFIFPVVLGAAIVSAASYSDVSHAQDARIIPVGDSITHGVRGQCSYRRILTQNMLNNPSCDVTFVGPQSTSAGDASMANCAAIDTNHAGFTGRRADQFTDGNFANWSNNFSPDHFLVHIGSNDVNQGESITQIIDDINFVRARIASRSPGSRMLLANVIPWSPVSPNPSSFTGFDNPDVDELAQSAALSTAIANYVNGLNDPLVTLVDVRSGFNNTTMTIDGVHPNDLGEAHIAGRFQQALQDVGVCNVVTLPTMTMVNNEWYQLSLPANPNKLNRVIDIFDNLTPSRYGQDWQVFGWDPNQSANPRTYTNLGLNGVMEQGRAYWAIQRERTSISIDMPVGSTLTPLTQASQCTSDAGCFRVPLTPTSTPLNNPTEGAFDWDMVGYPHFQVSRMSDTRVTTPASGPCSSASGCTPNQALNNQVMNNTIFRWNDPINDYTSVSGNNQLRPWDGFWTPVLSQGADGNSRWITAPE